MEKEKNDAIEKYLIGQLQSFSPEHCFGKSWLIRLNFAWCMDVKPFSASLSKVVVF